jgi:hypothetical protein
LAVAEHDLGTIEAESFDAETNLTMDWFGKREIIELEDFGAPGFVEANDFHGVGQCGSLFYRFDLDETVERRTH